MSKSINGLARRLVNDGLITESQALVATQKANQQRSSFVRQIVRSKLVDSRLIAIEAAGEFNIPMLDLRVFDLKVCPEKLVIPALIEKHAVLPLVVRKRCLYLATADPSNILATDEIKFHTGLAVELILVEDEVLEAAINTFLARLRKNYPTLDSTGANTPEPSKLSTDEEGDALLSLTDETPLVQFINNLLLDAIKLGASDIHFEPYEKIYRVRYRVDGILCEITRAPINLAPRLASRIKVMSQMNISEKRIPQDGRIKLSIRKNQALDVRVNTLPTVWGEKVVLRIMNPRNTPLNLDSLGLEHQQKNHYLKALEKQQGIILITGPTGSGKTVSLYSGLSILNTPERNISTVEDPVEINIEGINQVSVNSKTGLGFAATLRAFLRQDPDIVMVGEIRDLETAEIAIRAAQTGHLVLSTLHTLNAASTISRLRGMGIPAFNLANTVSLIIAQRLARKLCENCKERLEFPENVLIEEGFKPQQIASLQLFRAVGCSHCLEGYKGRIGFYEVVPISESMAGIIMANGDSSQIEAQARRENLINLRQSALLKVGAGLTSLDEANRLT